MRVAVYNQMFGMDGRSLWPFLLNHYVVHFQNNEQIVNKRVNLNETIKIIKRSKTDIIGIAEILDSNKINLKKKLKEIGYNYVYFSKGHKTKFRDSYINIAIASKIKGIQIEIKKFPVKNEMGGGGGIIHTYLPSINTDIINLHLACVRKKVYLKQMNFLKDYLKKLKRNVILMGDFNVNYDGVDNFIDELELVSGKIKTCPITFPLGCLMKDLDHIFVKGYKKENIGELKGYSDHKLIYIDLLRTR